MGRTIKEKKKQEEQEVYCICRRPDNGDFMICCDVCNEWFHGTCVSISRKQAADIRKYSCPKCRHKQAIVYATKQSDEADYSSGEEGESEEEEETFPIKRKLSNTAQEPPRKHVKQELPLRSSQSIPNRNAPSVTRSQQKSAPVEVKKEKREELDDNRKKSRSILVQSLMQGMKSDERTKVAAAIAKKEINDNPSLSEEEKAERLKAEHVELLDFVITIQPTVLVEEIETELYKQLYLQEVGWKDYNAKLRSLAFNLKDPKNPLLRARLLSRELDPSQLPPMSSTDLANPELTMMRKNLAEKALKDITIDQNEVESLMQMEKKWRGGGKNKSYSSAEVIVPTEINSSLPITSTTSDSGADGAEGEDDVKVEDYVTDDAGTMPEGEMDGGGEMEEEVSGEVERETGERRREEEESISLDLQGLTPAPALESTTLPPPLPPKTIWEGVLDMSTINEMPSPGYLKKKCHSRAVYVAGPDMSSIQIENSIQVKGKIGIAKLYGYLNQVEQHAASRAVTVAAVEAIGEDNQSVYKTAFNYFIEQQRAAVFSVRPTPGQLPSLEEVYVTPVPDTIPSDFPSLLRPPSRGSVSIKGKLLIVFIMRTAPASTPYSKTSPRRESKKRAKAGTTTTTTNGSGSTSGPIPSSSSTFSSSFSSSSNSNSSGSSIGSPSGSSSGTTSYIPLSYPHAPFPTL